MPGPDGDQVEAERAARVIRMTKQEQFGGAGGALALARAERGERLLEVGARLDLDERDQPATAGDQVDFTDRRLNRRARMR